MWLLTNQKIASGQDFEDSTVQNQGVPDVSFWINWDSRDRIGRTSFWTGDRMGVVIR